MEVEDALSIETAKCTEVIKARVAPLEEKIDRLKRNEEKLKIQECESNLKIKEMTGQLKLKEDKIALFKNECARKQEELAQL
jgi:hypothetical protein